MKRIAHLDGFRGLAILMVFFYHAYARWNELLGYESSLGNGGIFQHFHLGVQLFFLISGFVILLSLQRAEHFIPFMYRRWLRLFPAMLICSMIIVLTAGIFDERIASDRGWTAILPGLIFLDPYVLNQLTGIEFSNLDGPFWSIYVEMKFYVFAALFYFLLGSKRMVHAILACYLAWLVGGYMQDLTGLRLVQLGHSVLENLDFQYFGWFAAGAAILLGANATTPFRTNGWLIYGTVIALFVSVMEFANDLPALMLMAAITILFVGSMQSVKLQGWLASPVLLWFGFISYPLYLIHENMMVSGTITLSKMYPMIPTLTWPLLMLGVLSAVAWVVAKLLEPPVKRVIDKTVRVILRRKINGTKSA